MILQNKPRFLNPDETKKTRSSGEKKPSRGNSVQMSEESTAVPYGANFYTMLLIITNNRIFSHVCVFICSICFFMLLVEMYFTSHLIVSRIFTLYNYFSVLFKIAFIFNPASGCQNDSKRVCV